MLKRILCAMLSVTAAAAGSFTAAVPYAYAEESNASNAPIMEYLDRGLVAIRVDGGVYMSWRMTGTEPLDTTYDVYRNGVKIADALDATNYTDNDGFDNDTYQVTVHGGDVSKEKKTEVWENNYLEVPLQKPEKDPANTKADESEYHYRIRDVSAADLDGDGEQEIIVKWDPSIAWDNMYPGYTGTVYIDAYKMDGTFLWRIDMGLNIRAGSHYTQLIVYDFDCDGKAELALRTAPGSKDAEGNYVSSVSAPITNPDGTVDEFLTADDTADYRNSDGRITTAPDWITIYEGATGKALKTVNYFLQRGSLSGQSDGSGWGGTSTDNGNYSERYLANVAYLDGVHPSLIMSRGYYFRAGMAAYDWDGKNLTLKWSRDDRYSRDENGNPTIYSQGNHQMTSSDVDGDGYDEIVFGSAIVDHDGSVLNSTGHGHGDRLHVSDFDNDGEQEVFSVHEGQCAKWGAELRKAKTAEIVTAQGNATDVGDGVMGDIIPSHPGSEFWSAANGNLYDQTGKKISDQRPNEINFLTWWDGDLSRETLDRGVIAKYDLDSNGNLQRTQLESFAGISITDFPAYSADIFGDWREEVIFDSSDHNSIKIYTTTIPTEYKMTTFLHDTQYRTAVARQHSAYATPPHTSFYVGEDKKTGYKQPDIQYAAIPADKTETVPDEEIEYVIPKETFDNPSEDWNGKITEEEAPYKNVLSVGDGWSKQLNYENADEVQLDFLWKPTENNSSMKILDNDGNNIITLTKPEGAMTYTVGTDETKDIDFSLNKNNWYSVSMRINTLSKTVDFSVKDYSALGTEEKSVYGASFSSADNAKVGSIKAEGSNTLDNVQFGTVKYNVEMNTVTVNVKDENNNPVSGASVKIGEKQAVSDADGKAAIKVKSGGTYTVSVSKAEYQSQNTLITPNEDSEINIVLAAGAERNITVKYTDENGNELKASELAGSAKDNTQFTVPEALLSDIEKDGTVYEFNPDASDDITALVNGDTAIKLRYKEKITPVKNDVKPLRVNFGGNGFGLSSCDTNGMKAEYRTTSGGTKYGLFGNIGNKEITVNLPDNLGKSYIIEYDMVVPELENEAETAMVPYSGDTAGAALGIKQLSSGEWVLNGGTSEIPYAKEGYTNKDYLKNQSLHVTIVCEDGNVKVSLINKDTGITLVDAQEYKPGISGINKLVFKRTSGNANCSVGLGEVKAYTVGDMTKAAWMYGNEINVTAPSSTDISMLSCEHSADYGSASVNMMNGLTYALTDKNGNEVQDDSISIDSKTGIITVKEGAKEESYTAKVLYNRNVFKETPVNVKNGAYETFWSEDFEGEEHKFNLQKGSSANEYWETDPASENKGNGKIYGVGSRNNGSTDSVSDNIDTSAYSDVAVDLDFRIDAPAGNNTSVLSLRSSDDKQILNFTAKALGNGYYASDSRLIEAIYINGVDITAAAAVKKGTKNPESSGKGGLTRDTTGWLHIKAIPDFDTQKVHILITRKSTGETVYAGVADFVNTSAKNFGKIYISGARQYGAIWVDDIAVTGLNSNSSSEVTPAPVTPAPITPAPVTPTPTAEPVQTPEQKADYGKTNFEVTDDKITVTAASIVTLYDESQEVNATAFAAVYSGDKLINITSKEVSLRNGDNSIEFDNIELANTEEENRIKLFVWDMNDGTIKPVANAVEVSPAKTVYEQNYNNAEDTSEWTENAEISIELKAREDDETDKYIQISNDAAGNNSRGTFAEFGNLAAGSNYSVEFDMALQSGAAKSANLFILAGAEYTGSANTRDNNNQIFTIHATEASKTWTINSSEVNSVTLEDLKEYHYKISVVGSEGYITITDGDNTLVENAALNIKGPSGNSENAGGLKGIHALASSNGGTFRIDNIVVKEN